MNTSHGFTKNNPPPSSSFLDKQGGGLFLSRSLLLSNLLEDSTQLYAVQLYYMQYEAHYSKADLIMVQMYNVNLNS